MNIFELFGKIAINNKGANQAIDQTGKKANTLASTVGKAFTKVGKFAVDCGKTMAKGLAVGSAAMAGLVVKSMGMAGELEQNLGGSEAVFKQFAQGMQKTASEAYKNMGLSQSDYLATANKMGALFQGVGYTIEDSASITEKAMQRAADVASIMGIDVSTAMESIAGAAKGNFTMMDNLGVAVNDTAIANYALEKGITKSTAKMTTQEKVALAMELFMEKTAYAAGNYAKENETLAGSLTTAKAAFKNFLSGAGDAKSVASALTSTGKVISKKLKDLLPHLVKGINELIVSLTPELPGLIEASLPGIIEGAGALLTGLAKALPSLAKVVVDKLPEILRNLTSALASALPVLTNAILDIFRSLPEKLPAILQEAGRLIETIWSKSIWPIIQSTFKAVFGIELPKWHKLKMDFMVWWNNEVWPAVQDIFKLLFNIDLPDFKTTISNISSWWTDDVWPAIKNYFGAVFSIFTEDEDGQTVSQRLMTWWTKVLFALGDFISVTFGVVCPSVTNVVEKIKRWWLGVTGQADLTMPVSIVSSSGVTHGTGGTKGFGEDYQNQLNKMPVYMRSHPELYSLHPQWNADGAVFKKATIFNTRLGLQGVGEAGPEAVAPIGVLQGYVKKAVQSETINLAAEMRYMVETFTETVENLRQQPIAINIDSKAAAVLMAKEMTKSIGNRNIQALMGMGG